MVSRTSELYLSVVSEEALDQLLGGRHNGPYLPFRGSVPPIVSPDVAAVIWARDNRSWGAAKPLVVVCREQEQLRLFGRYATLRGDLSPLSPWCHVVSPWLLDQDGLWRDPEFNGWEAAWTGLVVAEALVLAERPLSALRLQSCLATQTFAVARTQALWKDVTIEVALRRYEAANRVCRSSLVKQDRIRTSFAMLWQSLQNLSGREKPPQNAIELSLANLQRARMQQDPFEARELAVPLIRVVPAAAELSDLQNQPPEWRLRLFDRFVRELHEPFSGESEAQQLRNAALSLLIGYLATVAAGGAPSLALLEGISERHPELTAWAYVVGGVGEQVVWTSSFDGLGRLVSRELLRPVHLDEAPLCDFSLEEAAALADTQLADPLVRLRVKQARVAAVAIFPGVNVLVPLEPAESVVRPAKREHAQERTTAVTADRVVTALMDTIRPLLRREIEEYLKSSDDNESKSQSDRNKKKRSNQAGQLQFPKK